ncbi:CopG family transcriptional regulator [Streptomyces pseudoechinosporeus]
MDDDTDFPPGDGPSSGISVTLTAGTLHAIRERVGKRGVSAYLEKAAQRQIERENLDELIAGFEEVHGPADPEAVAAKRARLTGDAPGAGAAA